MLKYSTDGNSWVDEIDYPNTLYVKYLGKVHIHIYREFSDDGVVWYYGRKPRTAKFFRDRKATDGEGQVRDIEEDGNPYTEE